jgi:hypothetical protein
VVGLWSVADSGAQTWAALSGSTANTGNQFAAGTVALTDNDGGSTPMFTFTNQRPGVVDNSCIRVNYAGSLTASVKMYAATTGLLAPYVDLTVTRGSDTTPAFDSCTSFSPDAINYIGQGNGIVYKGPLSSFPTTYATALSDQAATWSTGTSVSYRFTVSIADDNAAQGLSSTATFTWEARS